jgi:hypothetical protein
VLKIKIPLLLAFSAIVSLLILVVISGTGIIVPNEEVLNSCLFYWVCAFSLPNAFRVCCK